MVLDRSLIGTVSAPETFAVERGAIAKFAAAIGDPNAVFQRGEIAPPTFPTTFRVRIPGLDSINPARFIHGTEEYTYRRPIRAGDVLTCQRKVTDVTEREGRLGRMVYVTALLDGRDPDGELVFEGKTVVIIHGKEA